MFRQLTAVLLLALAPSVTAESVDEVFWNEDATLEVWLPASKAVSEQGEVDLARLAPLPGNVIHPGLLDLDTTGCIEVEPVDQDPAEDYPPSDDLRDLSLHARGIFTGRVTALGAGFYFGRPGTLLQIDLEESIKGKQLYGFVETFFVFYPKGELKVGPLDLCVLDPDLPPVPRVGDRILVYDYDLPRDRGRKLISPLFPTFFIQRPGGVVETARRWRSEVEAQNLEHLSQLLSRSRSSASSSIQASSSLTTHY